jgi:hypothetical protein
MANFIKMCRGVPTVKMKYQRAATILFYIKRSKPTTSSDTSNLSEIDEIDHSMNSHENSDRSRSSDNAKDDNNNAQNNVVICDVGCNSDRTRIEEVSIPVESTRLIWMQGEQITLETVFERFVVGLLGSIKFDAIRMDAMQWCTGSAKCSGLVK